MSDDVAAALDHENPDVTVRRGRRDRARFAPTRVGSDPDITQAQIFNNASGPLPLSAPLTTHGGTLAIFVSGTGTVADYNPANYYITGVYVTIDGTTLARRRSG
jgi:hypothetical protein